MQNKKGFSLLEMIIIVAIIVIMTMVMFVISFKDRSKKELEAVGREVAAAIREAQNNALTGRQRGNDQLPCSFAFVTDGSEYSIKGAQRSADDVCPDDLDVDGYGETLLTENISVNGMHISGKDSENRDSKYVIFTVPYGKYYDSGTQETIPSTGTGFVIAKDGEEKKFHVCVYSTGLIEEFGFSEEENPCPFY